MGSRIQKVSLTALIPALRLPRKVTIFCLQSQGAYLVQSPYESLLVLSSALLGSGVSRSGSFLWLTMSATTVIIGGRKHHGNGQTNRLESRFASRISVQSDRYDRGALLVCMCWAIVDNLLRCSLSWIPLVSYSSRCFVKKLSPEVPAVYSGILICDHRRNRWGRTTSFQTRSKHSSLILCSTGRISKWDSGNYLK